MIDMVKSPIQPSSNVHIHTRYSYVRELYTNKIVDIFPIPSELNLADLMVTYKNALNFETLSVPVKGGIRGIEMD